MRGAQIGYRAIEIGTLEASTVQGLFNLREFVSLYAADERKMVAELGVKLARDVLGKELFGPLSASDARRTLRIVLPEAETNDLAAALARVPWEIARAAADKPTLAEQALVVRAVAGGARGAKAAAGAVRAGDLPETARRGGLFVPHSRRGGPSLPSRS